MNQKQNNKFQMQKATDGYLIQNQVIWDAIPIAHKFRNRLAEINSEINETAQRQSAAKVYISKSQNSLKNEIAEFMANIDDSLEVYAEETNNQQLLSKASNSVSDYSRLTNEDFEIKVKEMISVLEVHLPNMADYGFSVDQLETVKEDFNVFQEMRGKPREYRISSSIATKDLAKLFAEASTILGKMDKIMKRFKQMDLSFYNGYASARMVIDK